MTMTKLQPPYDDTTLNHPYAAHPPPHQRTQHGGGVAEPPSGSGKVEGQWQWEKGDSQNAANHQLASLPSNAEQGRGGDTARSYYQGQTHETKVGLENQASKQARSQPHEQDTEIGYEDNAFPKTYEGLERKFLDDILNLVKEKNDAEDAENARHREKIREINTRYQEKISGLRAQQANRRQEFLRKESEARSRQYHETGIGHHYMNTGLQDARGYSGTTVAVNSSSSSTSIAAPVFPSAASSASNTTTSGAPVVFGASSTYNASTSSPVVFGSSSNAFGASSTSNAATSSTTMVFGSSAPASSGSIFPVSSPAATTPLQPVFGNSTSSFAFVATPSPSGNNDQMSMEDSMAEDTVQATTPAVSAFNQQPASSSGFIFGTPPPSGGNPFGATTQSGANRFQFGSQPNMGFTTPQNPSPFQASSSLEFNAGGSFYLGTGGGDKPGRRIVKVKKNQRKK